ncbi:MAG: HAD hydrolase-like protein [Clostridia bacterium]|nr:HAD hydrolase-like protein [Clostridia bacterium]
MKEYKLAEFLKAYDTILFDMDGVITSEQAYWDSAALTVYEMLYSSQYYGDKVLDAKNAEDNLSKIRKDIFCSDRTIRLVKDKGVNSNWDLAYVVLSAALISEKELSFEDVYKKIDSSGKDAFEIYDTLAELLSVKFKKEKAYFERLSTFWQEVTNCFQEWYLGDINYKNTYSSLPRLSDKSGFMSAEKPLVDHDKLICLLKLLKSDNKRLGVGTGRLRAESEPVLINWGAREFFDDDALITYNDVTSSEEELAACGLNVNLTKPHPFMFLKGHFGNEISAIDIVNENYDKESLNRTLVIGDAGADLFSARAGGFSFAAVLTGVQGQDARTFFEKENATFILNDVLELMVEK